MRKIVRDRRKFQVYPKENQVRKVNQMLLVCFSENRETMVTVKHTG